MYFVIEALLNVAIRIALAPLCVIRYWLRKKAYVFSYEDISNIALKYSDQNTQDALKNIAKKLRQDYPSYILPESDAQWVLTSSGGCVGSVCLLHASLTEYVLFYGAAIDTSGHSGRHWVDSSISVISGDFEVWTEGTTTSSTHGKGSTFYQSQGVAYGIRLDAGTWVMEYGRGLMPTAWPYLVSNSIFVNQDFASIFYIFKAGAKSVLQQLGLYARNANSQDAGKNMF